MEARYKNPNAQAGGIALAHAIHGSPVDQTARPEMRGEQEGRIQRVAQAHMRNYQPPKRRDRDNPDIELCGAEGCGAFPSKKFYPYCAGHARAMKLPGADWVGGRKPRKKAEDGDAD